MEKRIAVITGATGGIGQIVCIHLIKEGYTVYAACRNENKGRELLAKTAGTASGGTTAGKLIFVPADLKSFASVKRFCKEILDSVGHNKIDLLINNAGMIANMYEITEDGYESSMQVNYLSAKLITETLLPHIEGKIINTVSCTISKGDYKEPVKAEPAPAATQSTIRSLKNYSDSKFMLAHYTMELHRKYGSRLEIYGADPGIVNTSIISMHRWYDFLADIIFRPFIKTPQQGAVPLINAIMHTPSEKGRERRYPLLFVRNSTKKFPKKIATA